MNTRSSARRPGALGVIANVMLRLAHMLGEPNYRRCDNLHTLVLAAEGTAEVSTARSDNKHNLDSYSLPA